MKDLHGRCSFVTLRIWAALSFTDVCRTGYCKVQIRELNVRDLTASLTISKQLPKGMMLCKLKDPAWKKEGFLLVNVIRGVGAALSASVSSLWAATSDSLRPSRFKESKYWL